MKPPLGVSGRVQVALLLKLTIVIFVDFLMCVIGAVFECHVLSSQYVTDAARLYAFGISQWLASEILI